MLRGGWRLLRVGWQETLAPCSAPVVHARRGHDHRVGAQAHSTRAGHQLYSPRAAAAAHPLRDVGEEDERVSSPGSLASTTWARSVIRGLLGEEVVQLPPHVFPALEVVRLRPSADSPAAPTRGVDTRTEIGRGSARETQRV